MSVIIFFIILLVLVIVHEFGHFFSAKKFGIRVDEFGFGFPPKLFGIKKGETEYTFNLLPIGGFVKIFGENPNEESLSGPDSARSFANKPKWQQAIVLFAGVFANFVLAWILFSVGFMSGIPTSVGDANQKYAVKDSNLVIVSVLPESPAELALLRPGYRIVKLQSGEDIVKKEDLSPSVLKTFIASHPKQEIKIDYLHSKLDEMVKTATVTPVQKSENDAPVIGIAMDQIGTVKLPFFRALWEGLRVDWSVTKGTAMGFFTLISDAVRGQGSLAGVTGPVGMVGIVGDASGFGFVYLLSFAAIISINLAIINLIPFPALDGGHLLFLLIEKIKGSRLNPKFANTANAAGFAILIILMLVITYKDVVRLF